MQRIPKRKKRRKKQFSNQKSKFNHLSEFGSELRTKKLIEDKQDSKIRIVEYHIQNELAISRNFRTIEHQS